MSDATCPRCGAAIDARDGRCAACEERSPEGWAARRARVEAAEEAEERAIAERSKREAAGHIAAQQKLRASSRRRRRALVAALLLALAAVTVAAFYETIERAMAPEPSEYAP
ncbi:MAG: hypothetical protein U0326_35415 [Polyangiales bacterium]